VALHVLLLALLLSKGVTDHAAPPRGGLVSFDVELRSAPSKAALLAPRASARGVGGAGRAASAGPKAAPTTESPPPANFQGNALEGLAALGLRAAPDLSVRRPDVPEGGDGGGVAIAPPSPEPLRDWLREQAGRDRVANGLAHPYYGDVGRALLGAWDVEGAIERRGLPGYIAQVGENLRSFGRVWQELAAGYGKTGAPTLIDGGSERVRELAGLPAGPARDSLVGNEIQRQLIPAFSRGRVALVRVTQAGDGRLLAVELASPSSDLELDRAAVAGVRAAVGKLPPPPEEAREGREKLVTLWEFELEVSITPPIPVVAIEFDEVLGLKDLRLPLDRRIYKRVRLVAVM